jgi:hypothetical protein
MIKAPDGYVFLRNGPSTIAALKSYADCLSKQGIFNADNLRDLFLNEDYQHKGRGAVPSIPIEGKPGEKMVIRKYLRGGLLRFVNRDIYLGLNRSFNELRATVEASSRNIPTLEVLAAVCVKIIGPFYRGYFITKELSSFYDAPLFLQIIADKNRESFIEEKERFLKRAAETIRSMHDRGVYHGDLNMKNILTDISDHQNLRIIDWDKSSLKKSLTHSERRANVRRFCRSMAKFSRLGLPLTWTDQLNFLEAYWHGEAKADQIIKKDLFLLKISLAARSIFWKKYPKNKKYKPPRPPPSRGGV